MMIKDTRGGAERIGGAYGVRALSPANAGSFQWHVTTPAEAGVYFLEPPTAADSACVAGFRE